MMRPYSPLRYPGGKGKIAPFIEALMEKNLLLDGYYVEPYVGGAGVALSLLLKEYVSKIIINDLDRSIYAFWYSVLNKTDELSKLITDTPVDIITWRKQKQLQKGKSRCSLLALGFSTFYLNRTNRSGIILGGPIGGVSQTNDWRMDCRFNKRVLIQRIQRIASFRSRVDIYNQDAIKFLKDISPSLPPRSLIYLDPPYFSKGSELYENYYTEKDHADLSNFVKSMSDKHWIVSYDDMMQIRSLYVPFHQIRYALPYSAATKVQGKEVIIFSDNLDVPISLHKKLPYKQSYNAVP